MSDERRWTLVPAFPEELGKPYLHVAGPKLAEGERVEVMPVPVAERPRVEERRRHGERRQHDRRQVGRREGDLSLPQFERLQRAMAELDEASLVLSHDGAGDYAVSLQWGREVSGSSTAAAVALGYGVTLAQALEQALTEAHYGPGEVR